VATADFGKYGEGTRARERAAELHQKTTGKVLTVKSGSVGYGGQEESGLIGVEVDQHKSRRKKRKMWRAGGRGENQNVRLGRAGVVAP